MDLPITVPTRVVAPHAKAAELAPEGRALQAVFDGPARGDLSPAQRQDLSQLEEDLRQLDQLKGLLSVGPDAPVEQFETALAAKKQSDAHRQSLDQIVGRNRDDIHANLLTFSNRPGEYVVSLQWKQTEVSPALRHEGVEAVGYTLQKSPGGLMSLSAAPERVDGSPDWHYAKISAFPPQDGRSSFEVVLGAPDGYRKTEARAQGGGDVYCREDEEVNGRKGWTAMEQALAAQVLKDCGVGWAVPGVCPHCR